MSRLACSRCGRMIATALSSGKPHPHKCPHGCWCNRNEACSKCWEDQHGEPAPAAPTRTGEVTVVLKSERRNPSGGGPCMGYLSYGEPDAPAGDPRQYNVPSVHDLIDRALGANPHPGSIVRLTVTVEVVKAARPSTKKCHNPWPAHRCPSPERNTP